MGAGLYLDGLGTFAVNDQRAYATVARNSITGESGGVLLTPVGTQEAPTAPTNLVGVAHPSTPMEPYAAIDLTWQNTSPLTRGYELQRAIAWSGSWLGLTLVPPGTATNHTDTTVDRGVTYDYRVRAAGIGGASPWSATATVTAPGETLRVTRITLGAKATGSKVTVSGDVAVADASGVAVANATVAIRWTLPGGATKTATAVTSSSGRAAFKVSSGRGTYVLAVTGVSKTGYVFDAGASVLTSSITR